MEQPVDKPHSIVADAVVKRFTVLGGSIVVLEAILGAWPVVAIVLWGSHAVDTWIHFLYWIKGFFLFLAVLQTRWAPQRFARDDPTPRSLSFFELCVGATVSCELSTWMLISVVAHALLSSIVLLLVLVLRREFLTTTQWILSVVFDGVAIIESVGSPLVLTSFGLGPVMQVHPAAFAQASVPRPAPFYPSSSRRVHGYDDDDESGLLYRSEPSGLHADVEDDEELAYFADIEYNERDNYYPAVAADPPLPATRRQHPRTVSNQFPVPQTRQRRHRLDQAYGL